MNLGKYFDSTPGTGVFSTADANGRVNAAVYSKPYVIDENTVAFLMAERLSHQNLQSNPNAHFLFIEEGPGWKGKRLYLKKVREESNTELARSLVRRSNVDPEKIDINLVYFQLEKVLPLTGGE